MPNLHYSLHELPGLDGPKKRCPSEYSMDEIATILDALQDNCDQLDDWQINFVNEMIAKLGDKKSFFTVRMCEKIMELYDKQPSDDHFFRGSPDLSDLYGSEFDVSY